MKRAGALGALLLAATGCGVGGFVATPADYAAYRATRTAPTFAGRLAAADRYLARYPEGAFQAEVRAYFDRAEPVFFGAKRGSLVGLQDYASTLPKGPHHGEAEKLLGRFEAARDRKDLASAADVTAGVDRATAERRHVRAELSAWVGRFLDVKLWDAPLSQARTDLIVPWSLALPAPVCASLEAGAKVVPGLPPPRGAERRCSKLLELPYSVVVDGVAEAREIALEITLFQDVDGRPLEARIGGPDLFLRVEETFTIRALDRGESEPRLAAVARVAELVRGAFFEAVPAGAENCKRPPAAPIFLDLACQGLHATARTAVADGEDDLIVIRPDR